MFFWVPAIVGGAFGLLGGYLTDRFGRRRVLVWSILLYAFSAMAAGFSTSITMLLVLRSTTYIGVFVEFVAAVAWIAELFEDPKQRESALGYTQAFSSIGGLMVTGAYAARRHLRDSLPAIHGSHSPWRYTLISGVIPALPLIIIRPFLPESPAWRQKKAAGTLQAPERLPRSSRRSCAARRSSRRSCSRAPTAPRSAPSSRCRASCPGLPEVRTLPPPQQQQTASLVQAYPGSRRAGRPLRAGVPGAPHRVAPAAAARLPDSRA